MMKKHFTQVLCLCFALASMAIAGDKTGYIGIDLGGALHENHEGVYVAGVHEDSPALAAGLNTKDQIIKINDSDINSYRDLKLALKDKAPGESITITYVRDGQTSSTNLILGERSQTRIAERIMRHHKAAIVMEDRAYIGIHPEFVDEDLAAFFGVGSGVLVKKVLEDTPAATAGLRAGDVIIGWNGQNLENEKSLSAYLSDAKKGDVVDLEVVRKGDQMNFSITLDARKGVRTLHDKLRGKMGDFDGDVHKLHRLLKMKHEKHDEEHDFEHDHDHEHAPHKN